MKRSVLIGAVIILVVLIVFFMLPPPPKHAGSGALDHEHEDGVTNDHSHDEDVGEEEHVYDPANFEVKDAFRSNVDVGVEGNRLMIHTNGLPDHDTGPFPNSGNPNSIAEQDDTYYISLSPDVVNTSTLSRGYVWGIAINGIAFEPFTGEYYNNDRNSGWNEEATYGDGALGIDEYGAHVQPDGTYHYHKIPTAFEVNKHKHSTIVGYAADGFPVYLLYGYDYDTNEYEDVMELQSSWRLKSGTRPSGPLGSYTGEYYEDYEYVEGLGDLDECNGRYGITPEYRDGIYHYFITEDFPVIPRCFRGTPDSSFAFGPGASEPRGRPPR